MRRRLSRRRLVFALLAMLMVVAAGYLATTNHLANTHNKKEAARFGQALQVQSFDSYQTVPSQLYEMAEQLNVQNYTFRNSTTKQLGIAATELQTSLRQLAQLTYLSTQLQSAQQGKTLSAIKVSTAEIANELSDDWKAVADASSTIYGTNNPLTTKAQAISTLYAQAGAAITAQDAAKITTINASAKTEVAAYTAAAAAEQAAIDAAYAQTLKHYQNLQAIINSF